MIRVNTINGEEIYVNEDLIETIRITPDTVMFLTNGKRMVVKDTVEEVMERIKEFRRETFAGNIYISK